MYERFYELRERPFALSPDPDYLYPSRVHREALSYLRYGLESHAGFIVITGEIGSGKTTLLQTLLRGIDTQTTVGRIVNTLLEPRELLETIMIDFGLDPAGRTKPLLLRDLAQYLVDQRLAGRLVLLVIDEAQNLTFAALEELRMLSNLETEKSKLLQIALVGQPNLRDKLASPELEQLRQRITVSYHLMPLDPEETANYINHRLRRAATGAPIEFPRDVTDLIHARSRGVPRIINVICDAALVFGYAEERRQIDLPLMHEVMVELEATGVLPSTAAGQAAAAPVQEQPVVKEQIAPPPVVSIERERSIAGSDRPGASVLASEATRFKGGPAKVQEPTSPLMEPKVAAQAFTAPQRELGIASALDGRARALDEREQMVRQRERELADQRRVLAEEYRLLRTQRPTPPAVPLGAKQSVRVPVPNAGAPARFDSMRHESTVWTRCKRFLLGRPTPAVEEN